MIVVNDLHMRPPEWCFKYRMSWAGVVEGRKYHDTDLGSVLCAYFI